VFTNLTGDHLDYHRTMDDYLDAKAILFDRLTSAGDGGIAIVNGDDPASDEMLRRTRARGLRCSEHDSGADCFAGMQRQTLTHTDVRFVGPWGAFEVKLPLLGAHNVMNAMQALAVAHAFDINGQSLKASISTCTAPPGRLEPVTAGAQDFAVLVDYAHTDDALENVLRALRPIVSSHGKLRVVFGCGGDRDRSKRPRMAAVACKFADNVIITSDNPRTEDPHSIIDEIRAGVPVERLAATICEVDRAAAINLAIARAADGDIVLIAGKGHEDYQIIGTTKRHFDDREVAAAAMRSRAKARLEPVAGSAPGRKR
jgi:UDP-N-acetylmuramoyl-L-alanyl-D-glutamate--2,6-diaminopimelate ligase